MTLKTANITGIPKNHSMPGFLRLSAPLPFEYFSVLLMAALVLAAAGAAHAQSAAPSAASPNSPATQAAPIPPNATTSREVEAVFLRADTNRDGKLDRKEAERLPAVSQRFDQIDTDHDSAISLSELNKAAGAGS